MRLKTLKLLFCLSLAGIFPASAQNAQFSYHISNHNIQAFAQDADGYVWMGTARGLNRYNGTNYAIFYAGSGEEELNSNNILSFDAVQELSDLADHNGLSVLNRSLHGRTNHLNRLEHEHNKSKAQNDSGCNKNYQPFYPSTLLTLLFFRPLFSEDVFHKFFISSV